MIYRLIILTGDRRGEHITVTEEPMTIGCGSACDVRITDSEMAQTHAEIAHKPGGPTIHDLGSMNRILVNNHEVRQAVLKHGDILELGRTRFLVQVYVQAEVAAGDDDGEGERRRNGWLVAAGTAVVLLILLVALIYHRYHAGANRVVPVVTPVPRIKVVPPTQTNRIAGTASLPVLPVSSSNVMLSVNKPVAPASNSIPRPARAGVEPVTGLATVRVASASNAAVPAVTISVAKAVGPPPGLIEGVDRAAQDAELTQAATALAESKARALLAQVKDRVAEGDLDEAERLLTEVFWFQPSYPPALEQRARLLERRGRLSEARQQWAALAAATNTDMATLAVGEVRRIDAARAASRPATPIKRVRIDSTDLSKFPATDAFREMRLLTVRLAPVADALPDAGEVKVEFVFYERDAATGAITPAPDRGPRAAIVADGVWHEGEAKVVAASYTIPASAATNTPVAFYGYLVRVVHHGVLQDVAAQPRDLLPSQAPASPVMAPRAPASSPGAG